MKDHPFVKYGIIYNRHEIAWHVAVGAVLYAIFFMLGNLGLPGPTADGEHTAFLYTFIAVAGWRVGTWAKDYRVAGLLYSVDPGDKISSISYLTITTFTSCLAAILSALAVMFIV